ALARAHGDQLAAESRTNELRRCGARLQARAGEPPRIVAEFAECERCLEGLRLRARRCAAEAVGLQTLTARARAVFAHAARARAALERLRERREEEHRVIMARTDAAEEDDANVLRAAGRRSL
ncbi:MAG: hypothetical protein M3R44_05575, partial [Candidatus Eremiobacteraeota bacterium]|nr:hypothetical protein [Candidatus Eremiobacteraeota bacterium]